MREFRITFAQCDSSGIVRPDVAEKIGARLAASYGGFTRIDAMGGYVMADGRLVCESVFVFDVATESDAESTFNFASMAAAEIRRAMDQESVYFRNVNGGVHILKAIAAPAYGRVTVNGAADKARPDIVSCGALRGAVQIAADNGQTLRDVAKESRKAADNGKPPESIESRAAELRKIAESMAAADKRRGGGNYGTAADILATAADSYLK